MNYPPLKSISYFEDLLLIRMRDILL